MTGSVASIVWIVAFVVVTLATVAGSRKLGLSTPIALVAVGAAASFVPLVPEVRVDPEVILFGVLPPLLFASAVRTPLADIRSRGDSIFLLSVGLVALTVIAVGFITWWIVPVISLGAALAFGAIVAPTDAVAVTAIAGKAGLPRRVLAVLETESLLNDATALVALNASIAAIVAVVTPWQIGINFVVAVGAGVVWGCVIGVAIGIIRKRLTTPVFDTSLSLVVPYLAFIPAQLVGGSGILAVVVAGIYLGHWAPAIQSPRSRIAASINWRTIRFLLENAVFLYIGLSLSMIVAGLRSSAYEPWHIALIGAAILLTLIVVRFANVMTTVASYRFGTARMREKQWDWRTGIAVSSAGIRGVVTLAAAFLLPENTPERALLQFLAFVVVIGSLLEGLALPGIIRLLKLPPPDSVAEAIERQQLLMEAQAAGLDQLGAEEVRPDQQKFVTDLRAYVSSVKDALSGEPDARGEPQIAAYERLRRSMLRAERAAVLSARAAGKYSEPAVAAVLSRIDAEEAALRNAR